MRTLHFRLLAVDVGVPSVGSQAISNGAAFVPHERLEEVIRNLSSAFAMGLRNAPQPLTAPLLGHSVFLGTGTPRS